METCAGSNTPVMSTTSACGVSTEMPTILPTNETAPPAGSVPVYVNVAPCAVTAIANYASRNVAEPRTKSPTEPPMLALEQVAVPLMAKGPAMLSDPDTPAERIDVEM